MYVERDIREKFVSASSVYSIAALVGPRQAGKTTLLKELVKGRNAPYLMFDDPDVRGLFDEDIKKFESQYLEGSGLAVLDEVQYGKDAGAKLKYLADRGRTLWITSSSQTLLSKDVLSWLVGRATIMRLYPFSFSEFMRAKGQKEHTEAIIRRLVWEHIVYGGYPKVATTEGTDMKKTILRDLYELMVLKDVAKTFSIDDIGSLERFVRYLTHSIGNVLVYGKAASDMGLSFQTVKKYLDAMERSYLICRVGPFFSNKLKEVTKQPKIYFADTGLRNAIANDFPQDMSERGKLFENYVFSELLKLGFTVKYWQTKAKAEVDFVLETDGVPIPIEVKLSPTNGKIERSLRSFIDAYRPKLALVVSYNGSPGETRVGGCRVVFTDVPGLARHLGGAKK
ncbi:ATP-binding protein [Candidatus Micrarchaeota archaeon]|nr:ATP-binding protein [Candidatus Micrarchaeota archaeon]